MKIEICVCTIDRIAIDRKKYKRDSIKDVLHNSFLLIYRNMCNSETYYSKYITVNKESYRKLKTRYMSTLLDLRCLVYYDKNVLISAPGENIVVARSLKDAYKYCIS